GTNSRSINKAVAGLTRSMAACSMGMPSGTSTKSAARALPTSRQEPKRCGSNTAAPMAGLSTPGPSDSTTPTPSTPGTPGNAGPAQQRTTERYVSGPRLALLGVRVDACRGVAKILAGLLGNTYALIAEGVATLLDIFGSLVVWFFSRVASEPPEAEHPYGHGK